MPFVPVGEELSRSETPEVEPVAQCDYFYVFDPE